MNRTTFTSVRYIKSWAYPPRWVCGQDDRW